MSDTHQFIVHYPSRDDPNYIQEMGRKLEFRDLLLLKDPASPSEDDPFFYNYQMLVGRWWGPWTNNRVGLLRWDPGSGKTRGAFIWALMHMKYSGYKKAIFISNSDIILRAIEDEVIKYNNYDSELDKRTYKQGRRAHGKTIGKSRYIKKQGFERYNISAFMNGVRSQYNEMKDKGYDGSLEDYIRMTFKNYVIIVDEIHGLRSSTKEKKQYTDIITFLDAIRDICPMLFMTATPIVNTWRDIFSIIGMMHGPDVRAKIKSEIKDIDTYTTNERDIQKIRDLVYTYSRGLVSDRRSTGVVPKKIALPGPYNFNANGSIKYSIVNYGDEDEQRIDIKENIFPLFMSEYQTEYTSRMESNDGLDNQTINTEAPKILTKLSDAEESSKGITLETGNNLYMDLRIAYDFAFPYELDENGVSVPMEAKDLVYQDSTTHQYFPTNKAIIRQSDMTEENIFLVSWRDATKSEREAWNNALINHYQLHGIKKGDYQYILFGQDMKLPDTTTGLGKYSIKNAYLIWMMKYHPLLQDIPGFVHTFWVKTGVRLIGASLNTNGWEQYIGNEPIDRPAYDSDERVIPRFAIIDGKTKPTHITRIIEAFNSPQNRDGSILRIVLGSKKSGVSISLTNGQFFIELSPDFNKATRIQSEGRVFRANSLAWMRELGLPRQVFTADIIALPSILVDDEVGQEINDEYISDIQSGLIKNKDYDIVRVEDEKSGNVRQYTINPVTNIGRAHV